MSPENSVIETPHDYETTDHYSHNALAYQSDQNIHFITGPYSEPGGSDSEYESASPQHPSPNIVGFDPVVDGVQCVAPPGLYDFQQHENIGDHQPSHQPQQPYQLSINKRHKISSAKPFNRVSKAGKPHLVTPAGACSGLRCSFTKDGRPCHDQTLFTLPSTIRQAHPAPRPSTGSPPSSLPTRVTRL